MTVKLNKIIIVIISICLFLFLGATQSKAITLSDIKNMGKNAVGKTIDISGKTVRNSNYLFCVQKGNHLSERTPSSYYVKNYIRITGNYAEVYNKSKILYKSTNEKNAMMAYILRKGNLNTGYGWRKASGFYEASAEQEALWAIFDEWERDFGSDKIWETAHSYPEGLKNNIYRDAEKYATKYGAETNKVSILDKTNKDNLRIENGRIGPFTWEIIGKVENLEVKDNTGETLEVYGSSTSTTKVTSIESGKGYWIKFNSDTNNISLTITAKSDGTQYNAEIWYLESARGYSDYQNLLYTKTSTTHKKITKTFEYEVIKSTNCKVVKKDSGDNNKLLTGMKFAIQYSRKEFIFDEITGTYKVNTNAPIKYYSEYDSKYYTQSGDYKKFNDSNADDFYFEITNKEGRIVEGLLPGYYKIIEVSAPDGYDIDLQPVTQAVFEITEDNVNKNETVEVVMENIQYGDLVLLKTDKESGELIGNIGFYIKDSNGKYITNISYNDKGRATITYSDMKPSTPPAVTTTISDGENKGKIILNNIPLGTYYYEEYGDSAENAGYLDEGITGTIEVIATQNRYKEVLEEILNSVAAREMIVKENLTDKEIAKRTYNAVMKLAGLNKSFSLSDDFGLLINEIAMNYAENILSLNQDSRYDTAVNIANEVYPDSSKVENVVLVDGTNVVEVKNANNTNAVEGVLAAAYASKINAPILLLDGENIPGGTSTKLKEYINLKNIYVLGKTSLQGLDKLDYKGKIEYIAPGSREVTSLEIADRIISDSTKEVILTNSRKVEDEDVNNLTDGALISGVSAWKQIPIIYIPNENRTLSESEVTWFKNKGVTSANTSMSYMSALNEYLTNKGITTTYLIGTAATDANMEALAGTTNVTLTGKSRWDTDLEIIKKFYCDSEGKLNDNVNTIILSENKDDLIDTLMVSQLSRNENTVTILVTPMEIVSLETNDIVPPEEYEEDGEGYFFSDEEIYKDGNGNSVTYNKIWEKIYNIIDNEKIFNKDTKFYTLSTNSGIIEKISKVITDKEREKYKNNTYVGTKLIEILHDCCIYDTQNNELCTNCENQINDIYNASCYEDYIELLVREILNTTNVINGIETRLKNKSITEVTNYIEEVCEIVFNVQDISQVQIGDNQYKSLTEYAYEILGYTVESVKNTPNTDGNLEIIKVDPGVDKTVETNDDVKLPGVEFVIANIDENEKILNYIKINGAKGRNNALSGTTQNGIQVTRIENIAANSPADATSLATVFKTNDDGIILLKGLPRGEYKVIETYNPVYGYGKYESDTVTVNANVNETKTATVTINNEKTVGPIQITKIDEETKEKLQGVQFVIAELYQSGNIKGYVKVEDKNGEERIGTEEKIIGEVKVTGMTTVEANDDKDAATKATVFETGTDGMITINDILYGKYKIIEIYNPNKNYAESEYKTVNVTVDSSTLKEAQIKEITNQKAYIKLEGYVWVEGDGANKDGVYAAIELDNPDLAVNGMQVTLYDNTEKIWSTTTDLDGKYIFDKDDNGNYIVEKSKLANYWIEFTYDGLRYEAVATNTAKNEDGSNGSGSKAADVGRDTLNNRFKEVTVGKAVPESENEKVTELTYSLSGGKAIYENDWDYSDSTSEYLNIAKQGTKFAINATTQKAEYDLSKATIIEGKISNINFGIEEKENPDLRLVEDLVAAKVSVNQKTYTYKYNEGLDFSTDVNKDKVTTVKNLGGEYTLPIRATDIENYEGDYPLEIDLYYEVLIHNDSNFVTNVNSIINYHENICKYQGWSTSINGQLNTSTTSNNIENTNYVSEIIQCDLRIDSLSTQKLYLHYKISTNNENHGVKNDATIANVSEIYSYTTYNKDKDGNLYTYAGIDVDSAPGNYNISSKANKEDDTNLAYSLRIRYSKDRAISGTIWLDEKTGAIGDGILIDTETSRLNNVLVELLDANNNDTVVATTITKTKKINEKDVYGYYEFTGLLPGDYKLKYTYGDITFNGEELVTKIVDKDGNETELNVKNYKSTILNNQSNSYIVLNENQNDNAELQKNGYWIYNETTQYNDAVDNLETRKSIDEGRITFGILKEQKEEGQSSMDAYTAGFELGVELIDKTESNAYDDNGNLVTYSLVENIDFGIIERPKQNAEISKKITYIKVTLSNGQVLIEGDPSNPDASITYVMVGLDETVPMEIDFELLPATVEVKYTITVTDTSEEDYDTEDWDKNGIPPATEDEKEEHRRRIVINKVVDYLPSELIYDPGKTEEANNNVEYWATTNANQLATDGLISATNDDNHTNVKEAVSSGYTILVTEAFKKLDYNDDIKKYTKSVDLYATASITSSEKDLKFVNHTEIIDYVSTTLISDSKGIAIPGNYNPVNGGPDQADDDSIEFVITPPKGENKDYTTYYILGVSVLLILGLGIVIIKKKVINK